MASVDVSYHGLLLEILERGYTYEDPNRKGVNRLEILSHTFRHEFKDGFPAITTKKLNYNNVVTELLWFLRGDTNIKYLVDNGCNIWNKDAYNHFLKDKPTLTESTSPDNQETVLFEKDKKQHFNLFIGEVIQNENKLGDLGPVYGKQWRDFNGTDQISNLIESLKEKPLGTEHIVSSWNATALSDMALPPCHYGFQVVVRPLWNKEYPEQDLDCWFDLAMIECKHEDIVKVGDKFFKICFGSERDSYNETSGYGFELHWNQRSVDTFLGLPYNITSYATLALILEKITGYKALAIQGNLNKVHLYDNSLDAVKEQLSRDVDKYGNCQLDFENESYQSNIDWKIRSIDDFLNGLKPEWFYLINYKSYPAINVKMLERNE